MIDIVSKIWPVRIESAISRGSLVVGPDRETGGAKTSQCKLRKDHDEIRNYDVHRVDFSASILDTLCFSNILF